jgi:prepilin-type N-terminal cleavage/methylation domain-containing protein
MKTKQSGFTLLEILLVVGIIAILAGIVIVAINPSRQLAYARNTERKSDLKQINSALQQYYIDHREYPLTLTGTLTEICDTGTATSSSDITTLCDNAELIDLSFLVPTYLTAIPTDPQATTTSGAGYQVVRHSSRRIGLSAPSELGQVITINIPVEEVDACGVSGDATDPDCWSTQVDGKIWGPLGVITNIRNDTEGAENTTALILRESQYSESYPAAHYCATLNDGTHPVGTWYLPAKQQLIDGHTAQFVTSPPTVTGFSEVTEYWSSTEYDSNGTFLVSSNYGYVSDNFSIKTYSHSFVRCLR